jgi:hypothetical protein
LPEADRFHVAQRARQSERRYRELLASQAPNDSR